MAIGVYRMAGPHPQATHFVCDAEAEIPARDVHAGDTAYAKDTARLFRRGLAAWIESMPSGHVHVVDDVGGLQTSLDARALTANRGVAGGYASLDSGGKLPLAQLCTHGHVQADVTGLVTDLAGKAAAGHGHAQADISGLVAALAARPPHTYTRTTQDYTSIATALADIGDLPVTLAASTDYGFELVLFYQSVAVGTGLSLSMNGPTAPVGRSPVWESAIQTAGGPSTTALSVKAQLAANALHTTASVDQANTPRIARYFGFWPVGDAGGSLAPRFATEVAGSQVRILRGSWLKVY